MIDGILRETTVSNGRRARIIPDLIEESEQFGTLSERLSAAERVLSWRISPIAHKGAKVVLPDPLLAADLGLSTNQYEWLLNILGEAIRGVIQYPQSLQKLMDDFPLVFIAGLTGSALLNKTDSFWDDFRRRIGIRDSSRLEAIIRKDLYSILQRKKLATFSSADLSGRNYVGAIELHSILPNRFVGSIVDFLDDLHNSGIRTGSPTDIGQFAVQEFSHSARERGLPASVRNLVTHIPERASEVISLIEEIRALFRDPSTKIGDIEFADTHGLPEPLFSELISSLAEVDKEKTEPTAPSLTAAVAADLEEPFLYLDLELLEVRLGIPSIPRGVFHESDHPVWSVRLDDEIINIQSEYDWSTGGFTATSLALPKPFSRISAILPNGVESKLQLNIDRRVPVLFFREDGGLRSNQKKLGAQDVLVLAQSQTVLDASTTADSPFTSDDLGPVRGWTGWSLRCVRGSSLRTLNVKHGAHRRLFQVDRKVEAHWVATDATVPYLKGADLGPVFHRSPQLVIPSDHSHWSLDYFHVTEEGNREHFDSFNVEHDYRDEPFDVFDELDEPWVGRFEVVVRRGAKVHMRRTFNMAEGLTAKLSFQQAVQRGRFRVPHLENNRPLLSKAWVEFSSSPHKRVMHPQGAQTLGSKRRTRDFLITTVIDPDIYRLKVQVDAPRLQYWLPLRDEPARWSDSPVTINTDDLADNEDFQLKFPQKVHNVEVRVVTPSRNGGISRAEVISLSRRGSSNTWSCPGSRLTSVLDTNATYQVLVSWHLMTLDDYLRNVMDKYRRKEWFKTPSKKRRDPRQRSTAILFTITRQPLLTGADIDHNVLHLRLGRDTNLPLVTWAWLLHNPAAEPVRIPMSGIQGQLPDELVDEGPLIVDTREEEFLMHWEPEIPSNRSLVVGESILNPAFDPMNRNRWLFSLDKELLPSDVQKIWGIRDRMHNVLAQSRNRSHPTLNQLDVTTLGYLTASPRVSLAELDNSDVPRERRLEAFIRSGLATQNFSSAITAGDIHPTPWIGLIQEMNDLHTLTRSASSDATPTAERAESEHYVRTVGGHELWKIFSGESRGVPPVQKNVLSQTELDLVRGRDVAKIRESLGFSAVGSAFVSDESRIASQLAWLENRREYTSSSRLEELFQELQNWENFVDRLNDPEIKRTSRSLALIAEENHRSNEDNWLFVPYVSFVSSLLARAVAHRIIRPIASLHELRHTWASCARYAPELVSFDLVVAEAAALNARS